MSGIKLPLTLSAAGHALCLALLALFLSDAPPASPEPIAKGGIEVVFAPALPKSEAAPPLAPPAEPDIPAPPAETLPPPEPLTEVERQMPPVVASEPAPLISEAAIAAIEPAPPPPLRKPALKRPPRPVPRQQQVAQPSQRYLLSAPPQLPAALAPPASAAPPQTASAGAPVPSSDVVAGYRALVRSWWAGKRPAIKRAWDDILRRHPEAGRQQGEKGRAELHFEVDRGGRVIESAIVKSSGYPDLDAAIEAMLRGATAPPFPAGMTQSRFPVDTTINVSVE